MSCNLSAGRNEVCKDSIGGLAGVYFLNYTTGSFFDYRGSFTFTRDNSTVGYINRLTSDGTLLSFLQAEVCH